MRYCKSTIFQANHNGHGWQSIAKGVVCDTAKVRFFKQITTGATISYGTELLFAILQKYDFSSKSQPDVRIYAPTIGCLRYCKSTIFQANHNRRQDYFYSCTVVCDTAKVRFFKQITTIEKVSDMSEELFAILQKYDFSSKSQLIHYSLFKLFVVCDTAKVRFFKQITTKILSSLILTKLFAILQKYDFSSKSQPLLK